MARPRDGAATETPSNWEAPEVSEPVEIPLTVDTSTRDEDGPQPHQEPMYVEVEVSSDDAVVAEL